MIGYKLIKAGLKSVFQTRDALETMVVQSLEWFKYNEIPPSSLWKVDLWALWH